MGTHPIFESDFDCLTEMSPPEKRAPKCIQDALAGFANIVGIDGLSAKILKSMGQMRSRGLDDRRDRKRSRSRSQSPSGSRDRRSKSRDANDKKRSRSRSAEKKRSRSRSRSRSGSR